jgi:hypothetical protein
VLATGISERTLQALADDLLRKFKGVGRVGRAPAEGGASSGWILLDFGSVVVHLLSPVQRKYYNLEELWPGRVVLRIAWKRQLRLTLRFPIPIPSGVPEGTNAQTQRRMMRALGRLRRRRSSGPVRAPIGSTHRV